MNKALLAITVLFFLSVMTAYSQPVDKFARKGQWEIGGTIGYTSITPVYNGHTDDSFSVFNFSPKVSYFVEDGFEIGGMFDVKIYDVENTSTTIYTLYAVPSYNFKTNSMFYPYIQGQIGYNGYSNGSSRSGIAWALEGGVKANFVTNGLLKFGINYNQITLNKSGSNERNGYNIASAVLGAGIFF